MKPQSTSELWRARDQLATCLRLATEAKRRGDSTYESCFTMPRGWRNRGQKTVLLHGLRMALDSYLQVKSYPRLRWLRGDVARTLAIGRLRLLRFERLLRAEYGRDEAAWRRFVLERDTPCPRCQVRFYGGMDRWRQQTFGENGQDPLDQENQDLLEFEQEHQEHLSEIGVIKPRDYEAFERSPQ